MSDEKCDARNVGRPTMVLFHGTTGSSILGIISTGGFRSDCGAGRIHFSRNSEDTFLHGADSSLNAAFSIQVDVDPTGFEVKTVALPGNPQAVVFHGDGVAKAEVKKLLVRTRAGDEFQINEIVGIPAIRKHLEDCFDSESS